MSDEKKTHNSPEYALSFHDLNLVTGFKEAYESGNTKFVEATLHTNGFDLTKGYELVRCTHRTINRIEYTGIRVQGYERTDKDWLATGCASMEARIAAVGDKHLRKDLRVMSYQGTSERYD
ncbi:thymidylate synthase [Pseudomonas phage vB_PpuM-NoPa]|uniref:Thymidylate synthase n=4 Tax=Tartuvirus TaxID=3424912 RepID=A0AAX4MX08_9CAUD